MKLKDKVAIITGAAQGIGKETARLFLAEGAKLSLCDMDLATLEKTSQELGSLNIVVQACNVTKKEDCENVAKKTLEAYGRVDILINNAGITKDNLLIRMTEEEWDLVLNVNLKGVFHFTKACVHTMMKQRYGKIVNLASVSGQMGNPGQTNYSASKGGVIAMTKTWAKELAGRNIYVNAIAPGFIKTRLTDVLPEEVKTQFLSAVALKRFGEPQEIAKVCLFLASDESSYITGQVISVNGGLYM